MNDLKCPLCSNQLDLFEGETDDSGSYWPPSVLCSCGFEFKVKKDVYVNAGQSQWGAIFQHKENAIKLLRTKFAR